MLARRVLCRPVLSRPVLAGDVDFNETDHPRASNGQFGAGSSSSASVTFGKGEKTPSALHGIPFTSWQAPTSKAGW